jgi:hypothetical protein
MIAALLFFVVVLLDSEICRLVFLRPCRNSRSILLLVRFALAEKINKRGLFPLAGFAQFLPSHCQWTTLQGQVVIMVGGWCWSMDGMMMDVPAPVDGCVVEAMDILDVLIW